MSEIITMDVLMLREHYNHIPGAPDAEEGEIVNVPFGVGAKLVASGYAEAAPEDEAEPFESEEPEESMEEDE